MVTVEVAVVEADVVADAVAVVDADVDPVVVGDVVTLVLPVVLPVEVCVLNKQFQSPAALLVLYWARAALSRDTELVQVAASVASK